jgi:hypothetical protein
MKMSRLRAARLCFVQEAARRAQVSPIHHAPSIDAGGIRKDKIGKYGRSYRGVFARCVADARLMRCTQICGTKSIPHRRKS